MLTYKNAIYHRLLQEHELATQALAALVHEDCADDWESNTVRWRQLVHKHFVPLTRAECQQVMDAALKEILLFFDGGSRWNPGPGGSGSVVVRVRNGFELVWAAAMPFAATTTTNNYAEFQGLCTGLSAAVTNGWFPLTVIGDSAMILSLMRRRRARRSLSLQPLFLQARQAAATLRVTGWHHHYRIHNKMADKAANIAMDARRSFQAYASDHRPELETITQYLLNDTATWSERLYASLSAPDRPVGL